MQRVVECAGRGRTAFAHQVQVTECADFAIDDLDRESVEVHVVEMCGGVPMTGTEPIVAQIGMLLRGADLGLVLCGCRVVCVVKPRRQVLLHLFVTECDVRIGRDQAFCDGHGTTHCRRPLPASNRPNFMPAKWAPAAGVSLPSSSRANCSRVRRATAGSKSPSDAHSTSTSSTGQWTASPSSNARCVPELSTTIVLPGVCPGASCA